MKKLAKSLILPIVLGFCPYADVRFTGEVAEPLHRDVPANTDDSINKSTILSTKEKQAKNSWQKKSKKRQKLSIAGSSSASHAWNSGEKLNTSPVDVSSSSESNCVMVSCSHRERICAGGCGQLLRGGNSSKPGFKPTTESAMYNALNRGQLSRKCRHRHVRLFSRVKLIERVYQTRLHRRL